MHVNIKFGFEFISSIPNKGKAKISAFYLQLTKPSRYYDLAFEM